MSINCVTGKRRDNKSRSCHGLKDMAVALLPNVPHNVNDHPIEILSSFFVNRLGGLNPPGTSVPVVRRLDPLKDVEVVVVEDFIPHLTGKGASKEKVCPGLMRISAKGTSRSVRPAPDGEIVGGEDLVLHKKPGEEFALVFGIGFPDSVCVLGMDGAEELSLIRRA